MDDDDVDYALYDAIELKNFKTFRSLVNRPDFDVDRTGGTGRSLLMQLATVPSSYKFAKELIEKGANIHLKDKFGYSFLHLAARAKKTDNVQTGQLVIESGADVNCQDSYGVTPLYLACAEGNLKWIYLLLYYGADASIASYGGLTPFSVLSSSLIRRDDYEVLLDILFLHTFDCPLPSVSLSTLTTTMCRESLVFAKMMENISNVTCDEEDVDYFCKNFGDIKARHFIVFLEKFDDVVESIIEMTDLLKVVLETMGSTNCQEIYQILDSLIFSRHVDKLVRSSNISTSTISHYIDKFNSVDVGEAIQERIFIMLSYGLDATIKDLETVYLHYGCGDLFKTLLHQDLIFTEEQSLSSFVRLQCDLSFTIDECCDDASSVSDLLCYFNHPKLKELCLSTSEDTERLEEVRRMSQIPRLIELSRNVARQYVISRYKISKCKQFYTILNGLPIDRITKGIITLEEKIY